MDLGVMLTQERTDTMVGVGAWPNKIILDYLDATLAQDPGLPAITDYNGETGQSTSISYGELDRLSRRALHHYQHQFSCGGGFDLSHRHLA